MGTGGQSGRIGSADPATHERSLFHVSALSGECPLRGGMAPLPYIRDLMEKNYEAVGFIPLPALEKYAERGQILTQYENGDPCGYLAFGNGWPVLKVYQCCIQVDARRAAQASALVERLVDIARERNCIAISLWCADDLESNHFWQAMGFRFGGKREGGRSRGRMHNKWVLIVTGGPQLSLFPFGQIEPLNTPIFPARDIGEAA